MIRLSRLQYCGHVLRMNDHRLPKQIMYSEADLGERSRGRPKKNFRGCVKEDLKSLECGKNVPEQTLQQWPQTNAVGRQRSTQRPLHTNSPGKIKE